MHKSKPHRLFCDSLIAFQKLIESGVVNQDAQVFTRSFVLAENASVNTVYLDGKLSTEDRLHFKSEIRNIENALHKKLENAGFSAAHKIIFLQLFNNFQNDILDAALLGSDSEFDGATIIAVPRTGRPEIDEILRPCWIDWMAGQKHLSLIDIHLPYHNERAPRGNVNIRFADKLKLGGYEAVLWKIAQQNWLPDLFFNKGKIGIVGQTELARDVVACCVVNRHKPVFIEKPKVNASQSVPDVKTAVAVINEVVDIINERLSFIPAEPLRERARELLLDRVEGAFGDYSRLSEEWQKILTAHPDLICIFSGYGNGPSAMAMADSCQLAGVKIAAFQHGITRELLGGAEERSVFYETSFSDLFVTMNMMSGQVTAELSMNKMPKIITSCWPSPFRRIRKSSKKTGDAFLFVSTNLFSGYRPNGVPPMNDRELCSLEKELVENVFSQVNNIVDYKPYPAIRQLDADPVISTAIAQANMNVIGTHEDLRYLLETYRLFITSRATSTVSWLVASEKPLVFIDHYCHARLSEPAAQAFSDAFFMFDQSENDFAFRLRDFLNRPFPEIEQEWKAKSSARGEVIELFFSGKVADCRNNIFNDIKQFCLDTDRAKA